MTKDPWSDVLDAEHPVRWSPADGRGADKFLTRSGARGRLAGYYVDADLVMENLLAGSTIRTPFAFYSPAANTRVLTN